MSHSSINSPGNLKVGSMRDNLAQPYDFSICEVVGEAWHRVHGMKAPFFIAALYSVLVVIGIALVGFILGHFIGEGHEPTLTNIVQVITTLVAYPLYIGIGYLAIRRAVDLPIKANQIFGMYHYFWRIVGMLILQYLVIFACTFAFMATIIIFPSPENYAMPFFVVLKAVQIALGLVVFYMSMSFIFAYLLIVEKDMGVWTAYRASFFAFSQHWFKLIVMMIVLFFFYLLGALLLLIGLVWTAPMMVNGYGILYRIAFGVEGVRGKV